MVSDAATNKPEQERRKALDAFRAWINEIAREENLDVTAVARQAGLSPSTLTRPMNNPDYEGSVSAKTIAVISQRFKRKIPRSVTGSAFSRLSVMTKLSGLEMTELAELASGANAQGALIQAPDEASEFDAWYARLIPIIGRRDKPFGTLTFGKGPFPSVSRPPELLRSFDAFAVYCSGQQMEPVIRDGSLLFVDPTIPPRERDYVVIRKKDDEVLVREFIGESDSKISVASYGDGRETSSLATDELTWVYKIVLIRLP